MRKTILLALMLAVAVAGSVSVALAADETAPAGKITVKGINYNVAATLAKEATSDAKPELQAIHALKVTEATAADGTAIDALKGKTLHYISSKPAEPLQTGGPTSGKGVTVTGTYFADASAILVESYQANEGDEWDELDVNSLSGQQVL